MNIPDQIKQALTVTVASKWPSLNPEIDIVTPPRADFGDYSCAVALGIAKATQSNPIEVAETIKEGVSKIPGVSTVTVTPPGFVNFNLDYDVLSKQVLASSVAVPKTKALNVSVEHTHVNPNKAAHVGHLRNATLGDSVARLLTAVGHNVERQNYIDDLGLQVADSVLAYEVYGPPPKGVAIDKWFWKIYADINKKMEEDPSLKERRDQILQEMEKGQNTTSKEIVPGIVEAHMKTFKRFDITYDLIVYEHDIIESHLWESVFEDLKEKGLVEKAETGMHEGAWIVKFGSEEREDKVLVRSNGVPTYVAKDLAYELWKFGLVNLMKNYKRKWPKADEVVLVIDERQSYPQAVIKHTLEKLGYEKQAANYKHLAYGVVKLSEKSMQQLGNTTSGKTAYSMSGRAGVGVMVDDLFDTATERQKANHPDAPVEEIVIGSIRYYMLRFRPEREIIFDFDEALRTDGNTGVYLQYAYARGANILAKAGKVKPTKVTGEFNDSEKNLIKVLSETEVSIQTAADNLDPSLLCDYAYSLATAFAKFYETTPVLKAEGEMLNFRLALVAKYKETLGRVLELLGIPILEKI